jgi:hypothetical protein
MTDGWPWLALAGLGAFHGLNPAMGWLFAVALGMHRQSRKAVLVSLLPIAAGHALSIAAFAGLLAATGFLLRPDLVRLVAAGLLIAWAAYHWRFGHCHRVRFGVKVGLWGLAIWSFLMATAHGAGIMLWPALIPLCSPVHAAGSGSLVSVALAGVGSHMLAMLATMTVVAVLVYEWLGLAMLRRAWLNVDLIWTLALVATASLLVAV